MPVLYFGDIPIQAETVQRTTPSLKMMNSSGNIYYISLVEGACPNSVKISDGNKTYTAGRFSVAYWESGKINQCESVVLEPGCYRIDLMGGRGGDGGNNSGSGGLATSTTTTVMVTENTTVNVFRGGDGNSGEYNSNGKIRSGGGGGASGVHSMFTINGNVTLSMGGSGGIGGKGVNYQGSQFNCGGGGGGNAGNNANGLNAATNYKFLNEAHFMCGAGGGGATYGTGGSDASSAGHGGNAGSNATSSGGGNGGGAYRLTSSKSGGTGGINVSYTCAGTTLTSFGGGGGGGVVARYGNQADLNGGNGGSGSTGTSSTSYVRIYRLG